MVPPVQIKELMVGLLTTFVGEASRVTVVTSKLKAGMKPEVVPVVAVEYGKVVLPPDVKRLKGVDEPVDLSVSPFVGVPVYSVSIMMDWAAL